MNKMGQKTKSSSVVDPSGISVLANQNASTSPGGTPKKNSINVYNTISLEYPDPTCE